MWRRFRTKRRSWLFTVETYEWTREWVRLKSVFVCVNEGKVNLCESELWSFYWSYGQTQTYKIITKTGHWIQLYVYTALTANTLFIHMLLLCYHSRPPQLFSLINFYAFLSYYHILYYNKIYLYLECPQKSKSTLYYVFLLHYWYSIFTTLLFISNN
jgi:hypothetical protein